MLALPERSPVKHSSVALLWHPRLAGELLVVWHLSPAGYVLPGGKVEENESPEQALIRELKEETAFRALAYEEVYSAPSSSGSGRMVHVFDVRRYVYPGKDEEDLQEIESGCPVRWMSLTELRKSSPYAAFYGDFLQKVGVECRGCEGWGFYGSNRSNPARCNVCDGLGKVWKRIP